MNTVIKPALSGKTVFESDSIGLSTCSRWKLPHQRKIVIHNSSKFQKIASEDVFRKLANVNPFVAYRSNVSWLHAYDCSHDKSPSKSLFPSNVAGLIKPKLRIRGRFPDSVGRWSSRRCSV